MRSVRSRGALDRSARKHPAPGPHHHERESILHQILGRLLILPHMKEDRGESILIGGDEFGERFVIPLLGAQHQLDFWIMQKSRFFQVLYRLCCRCHGAFSLGDANCRIGHISLSKSANRIVFLTRLVIVRRREMIQSTDHAEFPSLWEVIRAGDSLSQK